MAKFIKITTSSGVKWVNINDIHEIREYVSETTQTTKTYIGLTPQGSFIADESLSNIITQVNSDTTFF